MVPRWLGFWLRAKYLGTRCSVPVMWAWAHGRQEKRAAGIRCRPDSRAANE